MKWLRHFEILVAFAAHILSAIAVFCIIALGALAIHWVRHALENSGLDSIVLSGLHAVELLMFACDIVATSFWAIMSTYKALKEITED